MPKQTFYNLPSEKRQIIEEAALDEFAEYGFDASNMNRIVEQSKIAKGSFYQYFEDKKDLYFHLIDTLFSKKMQCIEPVMQSYTEHSFIHNLKELLCLGIKFAESDPRLHRLGEDFSTKQRPFVLEFMEKYKPEATDIYTKLLIHAQKNGELREGVNASIAATFISSLMNQTIISLMSQADDECDIVVSEMMSFIEHAIVGGYKYVKSNS